MSIDPYLHKHQPYTESRFFRVKKPKTHFFCPLCRTQRAFKSSPRLTGFQYLQIFIAGTFFSVSLYPILKMGAFLSFFVIWGVYEFGIRTYFRREVPCPHCGFDASWYKRDVKVARRLVAEFWEANSLHNQENSEGKEER